MSHDDVRLEGRGIDELEDADEEAWSALARDGRGSAALGRALWERSADVTTWIAAARDATTTRARPLRDAAVGVVLASIEAAFAMPHAAAVAAAIERLRRGNPFERVGRARALLDELQWRAEPRQIVQLVQLAVLDVEEAAHRVPLFERGLSAVGEDVDAREELRAELHRSLGAAHLVAARWDDAFAEIDAELAGRPRPVRGGTFRVREGASRDPLAYAREEAATIVLWASATTPEWVRALGALAETHGDAFPAERYAAALDALLAGPRALDELDVVIRQLRERGHLAAAWSAATHAVARFPDDAWAHSVCANVARARSDIEAALAHAVAAAERLPATSPNRVHAWLGAAHDAAALGRGDDVRRAAEAALALAAHEADRWSARLAIARVDPSDDGAYASFEEILVAIASTPQGIGEHTLGPRAVDAFVDRLVARGDARAIAVQTRLLDAKLARWGECPAASLERHNVGTVHARLGDLAKARALFDRALAELESFGAESSVLDVVRRSIAKLG